MKKTKSGLTIIRNIQELDAFLRSINHEIVNHRYENEDDLPSYSVKTLEEELPNLYYYIHQSHNYVPAYYDCGLIHRCICLAVMNGALIDRKFFGQDKETTQKLVFSIVYYRKLSAKEVKIH